MWTAEIVSRPAKFVSVFCLNTKVGKKISGTKTCKIRIKKLRNLLHSVLRQDSPRGIK